MIDYRRLWIKHYGVIPIDSDGRSYEIHHVDGNRENNDISNLICVLIREHYNIHYEQEDWGACWGISQRINLLPEEISRLSRNIQNQRVKDGTHPFLKVNCGEINNPSKKKRMRFRHRDSGEILNIEPGMLKVICGQMKLTQGHMSRVWHNIRKHHKGWEKYAFDNEKI